MGVILIHIVENHFFHQFMESLMLLLVLFRTEIFAANGQCADCRGDCAEDVAVEGRGPASLEFTEFGQVEGLRPDSATFFPGGWTRNDAYIEGEHPGFRRC